MVASAQPPLIPMEPLVWSYRDIPLDQLPPNDDAAFLGTKADKDLRDSVQALGVLDPIKVRDLGGDRYAIEDGHRRVLASRAAKRENIPALVAHSGELAYGLVGLVSNETRSENIYGELRYVESLMREGFSVDALSGPPFFLSKRRVEYILQFAGLIDELRNAWADGRIAKSTAIAAVKLSSSEQRLLLPILEENGKLTSADVHGIRESERGQAYDAVQWDMGLQIAEARNWTPERQMLVKASRVVVKAGPAGRTGVRKDIRTVARRLVDAVRSLPPDHVAHAVVGEMESLQKSESRASLLSGCICGLALTVILEHDQPESP